MNARPYMLVSAVLVVGVAGCAGSSRDSAAGGQWERTRLEAALQLADEHLAAGKLDRAQVLLASFSTGAESGRSSDQVVRLQLARARIAIEQGAYAAAAERLAVLAPLADHSPSFHHLNGVACEGLGRWSEAAGAYQRAYALEPTAERLIGWLDTLVLDGRGDEACELLARERRSFPGNAALQVAAARLYTRQGDGEAAATELRAALLLEPDASALRERLARACVSAGDYHEAISIWRELIAVTKSDEDRRCHHRKQLADALLAAERYAEAAEVYRTLGFVRSDDADALAGLAAAELAGGRPAEALRAALRALRGDGEHVEARLVAALSYARMGRTIDALRMLDELSADQRGVPLVREMQRRWSANAPVE